MAQESSIDGSQEREKDIQNSKQEDEPQLPTYKIKDNIGKRDEQEVINLNSMNKTQQSKETVKDSAAFMTQFEDNYMRFCRIFI